MSQGFTKALTLDNDPTLAANSQLVGVTEYAVKTYIDTEIAAIPPGGDVSGPASSVDNNIVTFDGITGKLIKDSGVNTAGIKLFNYQNLY